MVTNVVSTRADLYCFCLRFCKWAGIAPPMFYLAMSWTCSAHVLSCWCSTGLLFLCLMSCWWLDSIFFIDRREPITSPCRLRDAIDPIRPRPAAGCAPGGTSVCSIRRIAIAASRARPRATRATRLPLAIAALIFAPHQAPQVSKRQFDSTFFHQVSQSD